jgi:predicted nucleic acid-binding protein
LWIAASALARKLPLLTRNAEEFSRVPGLQVVDYRSA